MSDTRPEPRDLWRWSGDLTAVLPLVVLLPIMASRDGGRGSAATLALAIVTAVAIPAVWGEGRRLPRPALAALGLWLISLVLGVVAARYRAEMVLPLLQYTVAPVLLLCTRRVWRRNWGPAVLLAVMGVALARYQVRSWLDWWAQTEGGTGFWRPLSWRNPSAALTGMFGVWFLGAGLMSRRLVRAGLGLLAATGFAGTWVSSSRAALAVTLGATVVVGALALRAAAVHGQRLRAPVLTMGAVLGATAALVAGLLAMQPTGTSQALASRDQSIEGNTVARIEHVEAAWGMVLDRPLTGQGLGSYKALARQWNDPNGNLTSSAHNEYAEVAAEAGVLGGTALLAVLLGTAWLGIDRLRHPPAPGSVTDLRPGLLVGAVGAAALFLVHSAVDFDWNYPVLSGLAAVAIGVMLPERPARRPARWVAWSTMSLLSVLLLGGIVLGQVERTTDPAPWRDGPHVAAGHEALDEGRPFAALDAAEAALRWNPASPGARSLRALALFQRDGDPGQLRQALDEQPTWFVGTAQAAMALVHAGEERMASEVIDRLHDDLDAHRAWGVTGTRLLAVEAEVALAARRSCDAARQVVDSWLADSPDPPRPLPRFADEVLHERLAREGC